MAQEVANELARMIEAGVAPKYHHHGPAEPSATPEEVQRWLCTWGFDHVVTLSPATPRGATPEWIFRGRLITPQKQ